MRVVLGILLGDGKLPNPGAEKIIEMYYSFPCHPGGRRWNYSSSTPGLNQDRGPFPYRHRLRGNSDATSTGVPWRPHKRVPRSTSTQR